MPVITLEVLTEDEQLSTKADTEITESPEISKTNENKEKEDQKQKEVDESKRVELLEYMIRDDGSVICKMCGEILQSRTHWYRHKYKVHIIHPLNPAPLFQCEQCMVYFKSRKGYIGHLASRHSDVLSEDQPAVRITQNIHKHNEETPPSAKATETDPELFIPKSTVPNQNASAQNKVIITKVSNQTQTENVLQQKMKNDRSKAMEPLKSDSKDQRTKEEKLVAAIIEKVRRECEAQGSGGPTRRGYSRKTTAAALMHT